MKAAEAIAEWVTDCKRECAAFGCSLKVLVISAKEEEKTLGPLFFSSPTLSNKVLRYDGDTKETYFLDVRLRFSEKLPEGKFWMLMDTGKKP